MLVIVPIFVPSFSAHVKNQHQLNVIFLFLTLVQKDYDHRFLPLKSTIGFFFFFIVLLSRLNFYLVFHPWYQWFHPTVHSYWVFWELCSWVIKLKLTSLCLILSYYYYYLFIYFIIILILSIIIFSRLAVTRQQSLLVLFSWFEKYLLNIYLKKKQPKKKPFEGKVCFFFSHKQVQQRPHFFQ